MTLENSSKFLAMLTVLLLITNVAIVSSQTVHASSPTGVVIPLYTYPGSTWDAVIQAKNDHPSVPVIAIINPNSGSGASQDQNYVSGIQELQSADVTVLGYVSTIWGQRSSSAAQSDIDNYENWYGVDGIFFDEMSTSLSNVLYYSNLDNYVKQKGLTFTMGNPGTDTLSSYVGSVDNMVIYETSGLPSLNVLGGWHIGYDKSNFSYLSYDVQTLDTSFVSSSSDYVSYIYITNDDLPNPWDSLPPYFPQLMSALDVGMPSTNQPPVASDDVASTVQDTSVTIDVLANDSDPDGDVLTINSMPIQASNGQANINSDSTVTYLPDSGFTGTDSFSYSITDGNGETDHAVVEVTVNPSNPVSSTLTINSVDLSGSPAPGLWTEIYEDGSIVEQGYTPMTFTATTGNSYTISVSDYGQYQFDHWEDQSTIRDRTITASSDETLTAYYSTSSTLTINSVDLSGSPAPGLWTEIYEDGSIVEQGYTPMTFTATTGNSYTISVSDYGQYQFDHWEDQSTIRDRTITASSDETLTAYYSTSVTLTVKSAGPSENPLTGLWTELIQNGETIETGFTTKSFQVSSGNTYVVYMADYQNYVFDHWENGSTDRYRTIEPLQDTTIIAYYMQ